MFKLIYIDNVPQDGNAFSDYGTFCHSLLEEWAKKKIPSIALASAYKDGYDKSMTHGFPPFPKGMEQKYYESGLEYFKNFDGFGDEYDVLSVEEKFEIDIRGYRFVGIADLVLRNKNTGDIEVIDHKSKSSNSMKRDINTFRKQLYTYAAFVKEKYGVYPSKLRFNMFKEGYFIDEIFDESAFNETMGWIVETIERIKEEKEWKICQSSYFCRFVCSTLLSCPAKDAVLYSGGSK